MKDKEMIEEMAKMIEKAKQHIWASVRTQAEDEDYLWHSRAIAEHLMLQGYRKIPEDSVVLSKEEYTRLKLARDICCHDLFIATKQSHEEGYKRGYEKGKYEARKETAEKIIAMLKQPPYIDFIESWVLDELAKQFGVEIK